MNIVKKYFLKFSAVALIMQLLVSCSSDTDYSDDSGRDAVDMARRLTFVYIMAENSLADYAGTDVDEMCSAAASVPEDCKLVVFLDDRQQPRVLDIYNNEGVSTCDVVHTFEEDFCSSDTANMRMVFDYVLENFPAESMNLVMWSHGSGWINGDVNNMPAARSIGIDNERNSYSNTATTVIEIEELAALLESLPVNVELLMFDACFMQTVETAYALRNVAEWILASPAEIPADGAPYDKMMESFFSFPLNVEAVMNDYYEMYKDDEFGVVLSLVQCSAMQEFADCTAMYVPNLFSRLNTIEYASLFSYLPGGYFVGSKAYYPDYIDINSAMKKYLTPAEYSLWKRALDKAVPYAVSSPSWYSAPKRTCYRVDEGCFCGLSFYIPRLDGFFDGYNREFADTEWYDAAGWGSTGW